MHLNNIGVWPSTADNQRLLQQLNDVQHFRLLHGDTGAGSQVLVVQPGKVHCTKVALAKQRELRNRVVGGSGGAPRRSKTIVRRV